MKEERGSEEKIGTGGEREERQVQGEEDEPGEVEEEGGGDVSLALCLNNLGFDGKLKSGNLAIVDGE